MGEITFTITCVLKLAKKKQEMESNLGHMYHCYQLDDMYTAIAIKQSPMANDLHMIYIFP